MAEENYRRRATQGDPKAKSNLGHLYMEGIGVEKDYVMAYRWFMDSKMAGEITAEKSLEELEQRMTPQQLAEGKRLVEALGLKDKKAEP
jgi:hypothetical protein